MSPPPTHQGHARSGHVAGGSLTGSDEPSRIPSSLRPAAILSAHGTPGLRAAKRNRDLPASDLESRGAAARAPGWLDPAFNSRLRAFANVLHLVDGQTDRGARKARKNGSRTRGIRQFACSPRSAQKAASTSGPLRSAPSFERPSGGTGPGGLQEGRRRPAPGPGGSHCRGSDPRAAVGAGNRSASRVLCRLRDARPSNPKEPHAE